TKGLGFEDILIPAWAAGFSAFGCGAADFEYRYDKTLDLNLAEKANDEEILTAGNELQYAWDELKGLVADEFKEKDYTDEDITNRLLIRKQYKGQRNNLEIEAQMEAFKNVNEYDTIVKTG